ncbi:MAG: insulinase family protein, partial [Sphingobacteriales bacterium]
MQKILLYTLIAAGACLQFSPLAAQNNKTAPKMESKPKNNTNTPKKSSDKVNALKTTMNSTVQEFDVNGVKVILKPAENSVVSAQLFITGGVTNYDIAKQGIENLTLSVLADAGSKKFPKEDFHNIIERKGIYIQGSTSYDYSLLSLRTLAGNWDQAWDIFSDVILNPSWDEQSFEQNKGQIVNGLKQSESDPDNFLNDYTLRRLFKGKRYETSPAGKPESVSSLTLEDLKNHWSKIAKHKKMMLVVVGKISQDDLRNKVAASLAKLPAGTADAFVTNPVKIDIASINVEERDIATNYMRGVFSAPPRGTRENIAMRMATAMLSERLFVEIRTKRNLSYAPSASLSSMFDPYSSIYVTTTKPNDAVQVMTDEIRKVKKEGFNDKEFKAQKEGFLTSYYMNQETNEAQAITLGVNELIGGWEKAESFKDDIYSLTLEEVNTVFRKYANALNWYYLGKKADMDE